MSQFYVTNPGGAPAVPTDFVTNNGTAITAGNIINVLGTGVASSGVSTAGNLWTTGSGNTVTIFETKAQFVTNYTAVNANSYVVQLSDYYVAVNSSSFPTSVTLPVAPTTGRLFVIKDTSGNAQSDNITVTAGGTLIDGSASYIIIENYGAANFLYNGTSYETF